MYWYGFKGTEKWYNNISHDSEVVVTYDSENAVYNDRTRNAFFEKTFNPTGDWELSFDAKGNTKYNAGSRWGIKGTSTNSVERSACSIQIENYNAYVSFAQSDTSLSMSSISAIGSYTNFKFKAVGTTLEVYRDDSLIKTYTNVNWLNDELTLYIQCWVNTINFWWKNVKLKPL